MNNPPNSTTETSTSPPTQPPKDYVFNTSQTTPQSLGKRQLDQPEGSKRQRVSPNDQDPSTSQYRNTRNNEPVEEDSPAPPNPNTQSQRPPPSPPQTPLNSQYLSYATIPRNRNPHETHIDNNMPDNNNKPLPTDITEKSGVAITTRGGFSCTAPPGDHFPTPQLGHSVTKDLDPSCIAAWNRKPDNKVWIRVWRANYRNLQNDRAVIATMLANIFGEDRGLVEPKISSPTAIDSVKEEKSSQTPNKGRGPGSRASENGPIHFLAHSLTKPQHDFLVKLGTIASGGQAIFILPFIQPIPSYITTIGEFSAYPSTEVEETIKASILEAIDKNPETAKKTVDTLSILGEDAVQKFAATLYVKHLEIPDRNSNTRSSVWNLYSPTLAETNSFQNYLDLVHSIRKLTFKTIDYSTGVPRIGNSQPFCMKCKSLDHITSGCPLDNLPGWQGPRDDATEQSIRDMDERIHSNRQHRQSDNRGGRGRGRRARGRGYGY